MLRASLRRDDAAFHPGQWEAIEALVKRRQRVLIVQRTGWGKSTVYFIATRMLRQRGAGPTLIVSPLLALMRNQIDAAERIGVTAHTINSGNDTQWDAIEREIRADRVDALLIAPERFANERFMGNVLASVADRVGLLVIDEAHCISDWGHDFRPDYQRISNILRRIPQNSPIVCTTATANDRVIDDISDQLGELVIQRGELMRESLALQTQRLSDQTARLAWLADHIPDLPGTGIVYTLTTRDAEQVAAWLQRRGIEAVPYHGSVTAADNDDTPDYRQRLEQQLLHNQIKVVVATSALGMGFDKPDLGFVIHYQAPGSIIAYYQQVGRAGRAIDTAYGVLFTGAEDDRIQQFFMRTAFPSEKEVQQILDALEEDGLSMNGLQARLNMRQGRLEIALKFLSVQNPAPVIKDGATWLRTPVNWEMNHDRIARLTGQRQREWGELQRYIDHDGCLMRFLAEALDDPSPSDCGRCANCRSQQIVPTDVCHQTALDAARFLRHAEFTLEPKRQFALGAFETYGWRGNIPPAHRAEPGRVLCRWGDAGWGTAVALDKQAGCFRDELVHAAANMIEQRWRPKPPPSWVTYVPSQRHPELVPDFASRLANALELPLHPIVLKVLDNQPQKDQQNRYHQCRNLDGAFLLDSTPPEGPVLLIDDVVDSGWTLAVIATLLRQSGSGPVLPFALASASPGN